MSRVCFVMLVYQGDYVLRECLQSILPYGKVVVAEGAVSYFRERGYPATSTDYTNKILEEMVGEENVVHGTSWQEKDDMMRGIEHLIPEDTTHCWMVDSDEIIYPETMQAVLSQLDEFDSATLKPYTFFGGFDRTLSGFEERFDWYRIQRWYPGATWASHRPPTVNAPDGNPWREHRNWDSGLRFAHYSYVWASQVKMKSEYYATRSDCIPAYFTDVWLRWVLGNDLTKQIIENENDGVHEWRKERRGSCRTVPFTGQHPKVIQDTMPRLLERFERELDAYR